MPRQVWGGGAGPILGGGRVASGGAALLSRFTMQPARRWGAAHLDQAAELGAVDGLGGSAGTLLAALDLAHEGVDGEVRRLR